MDFQPKKKYVGSTDNFSIEMYPHEIDRCYKKGVITVYFWYVRTTYYGVPKKARTSLGPKGVLELVNDQSLKGLGFKFKQR